MKNKRLLTLSVIICVAIVMAALPIMTGCAKPAAPTKVTELKWNVFEPQTDARWVKVWEPFWKAEMDKRTKGAVKITPFFSGGLAPAPEAYTSTVSGVCDMTDQQRPNFPRPSPMLSVPSWTLPSQSCQRASRAAWELYKQTPEMQAEFADTHLLMFYSPYSYFIVGTREKPVRTLEDAKGLKLWALGVETTAKVKAIGATPVSMQVMDVYMALQTGVLDGIAGNIITLTSRKFNEVLKYVTDVNITYGYEFFVMNKNKWNSLPPDIQKVFNEVNEATVDEFDKYVNAEAKLAIDTSIKERGLQIIKLTPEELARWDKVCQTARDAWLAEVTATPQGAPAKKALALWDQLVKKYAKI